MLNWQRFYHPTRGFSRVEVEPPKPKTEIKEPKPQHKVGYVKIVFILVACVVVLYLVLRDSTSSNVVFIDRGIRIDDIDATAYLQQQQQQQQQQQTPLPKKDNQPTLGGKEPKYTNKNKDNNTTTTTIKNNSKNENAKGKISRSINGKTKNPYDPLLPFAFQSLTWPSACKITANTAAKILSANAQKNLTARERNAATALQKIPCASPPNTKNFTFVSEHAKRCQQLKHWPQDVRAELLCISSQLGDRLRVKPGDRVLEWGGVCSQISFLLKSFFRAAPLLLEPDVALAVGASTLRGLKACIMPSPTNVIPSNSFERVVSYGYLEQLEPQRQCQVLHEMLRVATKDGSVWVGWGHQANSTVSKCNMWKECLDQAPNGKSFRHECGKEEELFGVAVMAPDHYSLFVYKAP